MNADHTHARIFVMYRRDIDSSEKHNNDQKVPGDQVQFEGVQFHCGTVVICWRTAVNSVSVFANMEDMLKIHEHPEYGSELIWLD